MQRITSQVTDQAPKEQNKLVSEITLNCVTQFTVITKSNKLYTQMDDLLVSTQFTQRIGERFLDCCVLKLVEAEEAGMKTGSDADEGEAEE